MQENSKVAITTDNGDLYTTYARALELISQQPVEQGDYVLIKPNLVQPASPESGQITSPKVVEAIALYCLNAGARKVVIGEGPSYYQPESQLRECFTRTGISQLAKRLNIEWVLFDEYSYHSYRPIHGCIPGKFHVSKFAFECDKIINIPVLKTHFLTKVTLAMKNLKGFLKREDKPLFHRGDLSRAVVELNKLISPALNVIDCTARNIGKIGNIDNGASLPKQEKAFLIVSSDIVAVDTVGSAIMGIDPFQVDTIKLGGAAGLGQNNLAEMEIAGEEIKRIRFKTESPKEQLRQDFPLLTLAGMEKACSGCLIPLFSALFQLQREGAKLKRPLVINAGTEFHASSNGDCLWIGDCAAQDKRYQVVAGCPPDKESIINELRRFVSV
jgi:uncharacterized protein (DUF362 family)